ncbi:hypothetical protein ACFOGI_11085 [Virgibacillus xinjiangensis]|uniref:Uncharacterized protein n=1 Tax=Virgibacillus xinjiangensis TaxID=393090 RepID=A0ABV7CWF7_9BACI
MYKIIAKGGSQAEIYLASEGNVILFETLEEAEQFLKQVEDGKNLPKNYEWVIVQA